MLLTGYAVAIVAFCVTKMTISCLLITGHFFDGTLKLKLRVHLIACGFN